MANIINVPAGAICFDIDIDIKTNTFYDNGVPIRFMQYDTNSKYIRARVLEDGVLYNVPSSATIAFMCTKPKSKHGVVNECGIDNNGNIIYKVTDQTTTEDSIIYPQFVIFDTENNESKRKGTTKFKIFVESAAVSDDAIISTPEFNLFTSNITIIGELTAEAEQLLQDVNSVLTTVSETEAERVSNEQNRVANENERTTKEGNRILNETARATAETNRASSENNRTTAETSRASAETARATSESSRTSAELTRVNQENTRQTQETARQNYYTAYKVLETYNNTKAYIVGNKVTYNGSTYQCITNCTGVLPTTTSNWIQIAAKGFDGAGGDMFKAVYDPQNKATDIFNYVDNAVASVTFENATTTADGLMSKEDKIQVDKIGNLSTLKTTSKTELVGSINEVKDEIGNKVDKLTGKGLSTNDYTTLEKAEVTKIATKADKSYVDTITASIASGSPAKVFATLAALQADSSANTVDGKKKIYLVTADGKWYYWNGSAWTAGGTYQATGIANGSITPAKTSFFSPDLIPGRNLFNKNDPETLQGKYVSVGEDSGVFTAVISSNVDYVVSHYIAVKENTKYVNTSQSSFKTNAFYDINKQCIGKTTLNNFTTTVGTKYVRINLLLSEIDTTMFYEDTGEVFEYEPYKEYYQLSENITVNPKNLPNKLDMNNLLYYEKIYTISDAINHWKNGEKFPVAFMGDSTTDGATVTGNVTWDTTKLTQDQIDVNTYPYLLEQKLKAYTGNQNMRIYNAGFSGWDTSRALSYFYQVFGANAAYSDVKMIGFVYGINDRSLASIELFKENLKQLCLACYKKRIQPFIVTPQIIIQGSSDFTSKQTSTQLVTVIVRSLKDFAKKYNLEIIDMNKATTNFITNAEIPIDSILPDTLHFGDAGHKFEASFLYSQFIGETIEVTDDTEIKITNPYIHYSYDRNACLTDSVTFRRYVNYSNVVTDILMVKADVLNSADRKLILSLDVSSNSNFYFKVDGVIKLPTDIIELEIGHHVIEVYAGVGTIGKYYGFKLNKKQ